MLTTFLKQESAGGVILMIAAALGLLAANTGLSTGYFALLDLPVTVSVGELGVGKALLLWINDGIMALFFLVVGLEMKREVLDGQLSSWRQSSLPLFAALGGMALPALVFLSINHDVTENLSGWAIPAATDIAFALGVLALLGNRVPYALKALLLAIAVIDDIGAIAIIALFYSKSIDWSLIIAAIGVWSVMAMLGRARVGHSWPYVTLGLVLWLLVLKSGVHATLAGVAAALTIPMASGDKRPLENMEHALHPWVAFMVVPIFAFANAGVSLAGIQPAAFAAPLPLGIAAGLVIGKQLGIFGFAWMAVKLGLASLPQEVRWAHVHGLSLIAGIGFTMSLFIGNLAFANPDQIAAVKLGVLTGSLIAAVAGVFVLSKVAKGDGAQK